MTMHICKTWYLHHTMEAPKQAKMQAAFYVYFLGFLQVQSAFAQKKSLTETRLEMSATD